MKQSLLIFFLSAVLVFGVAVAETPESLYDAGTLIDVASYPIVLEIAAEQFVADYRDIIEKEWTGNEFRSWIDAQPALRQTLLTAIDPRYDDIPAALRLFKRLCTDYPEKVLKYPGLAVAAAVVWDQPNSKGFAADSREQYRATAPRNSCDDMDNFLFYSDEKHPAAEKLQKLPWEILVYVVSNKRSKEERAWVFEQYVKDDKVDAEVPAKAYDDIRYNHDEVKSDPKPALAGLEYSLQNIRKHGGVCTAQADYALPVARTLGIPAFYGGAGFPPYFGGHSWIMWLDIDKIDDDGISYDFKEKGRGNSRFYVAGYESPQTGRLETDEDVKRRFHRVCENLTAYRHATLLMRCYRDLAKTKKLSLDDRIALLLKINDVSPHNTDVWREIAVFGKTRQFTNPHRQTVQDLAHKMREDLIDFPNELPGLTYTLISFPEIRDDHWRQDRWLVYEPLFKALENRHRPDLTITATIDFNRMRTDVIRERVEPLQPSDAWIRHMVWRQEEFPEINNALFMLKNLPYRFPNEIAFMLIVFDEIESLADLAEFRGFTGRPGVIQFYSEYAEKIAKEFRYPKDYRHDVFRRILRYAEKHGFKDRVEEMKKRLEELEKEEPKKLPDDRLSVSMPSYENKENYFPNPIRQGKP